VSKHRRRPSAGKGFEKAAPAKGLAELGGLQVNPVDHSASVDLKRLEAPSQVYDADFAWVEHRPGRVSLFFGKRGASQDNVLASRLEIRYPAESIPTSFWKNSVEFFDRLRLYVERWPASARERDETNEIARRWGAVRTHSDWANFTYMAHSGTEASIDFYHLSAAARARFSNFDDLLHMKLRPVARVQMTIFTLGQLVDALEPVVAEIDSYRPRRRDPNDPVLADEEEDETKPSADVKHG
jgi:hypothetical protein